MNLVNIDGHQYEINVKNSVMMKYMSSIGVPVHEVLGHIQKLTTDDIFELSVLADCTNYKNGQPRLTVDFIYGIIDDDLNVLSELTHVVVQSLTANLKKKKGTETTAKKSR